MTEHFDVVILGLTITSSWGNGHATTWRSLVRGLSGMGYKVLFLERDAPWYAQNRDNPQPMGATSLIYHSVDELMHVFESAVAKAGLVIVGSFVPDGIVIGDWVTAVASGKTAFYDIDTPITLARLAEGTAEYISTALIPKYDAYLSFTGGPILQKIEETYGTPMARALYCSVDTELYRPRAVRCKWDLGYLGTYSEDRQPFLNELLLSPARERRRSHFVVAGPQYPEHIEWPTNVERIIHLSPSQHPSFYSAQRFTLNVTRTAMKQAGYSPSVRLFEAAACGVPIITDWWEGLDTLFSIGKEILVAHDEEDVLRYLRELAPSGRARIAAAARSRILAEHTAEARAKQLRSYLEEMNDASSGAARRNRRYWQVGRGLAGRLGSEQQWQSPNNEFGEEAVLVKYPSNLHEPA
ncbi:MAG TPA: glycosyltransferase [Bryobacteraceae bacterium]|jgi:spore maturation protein CgeB|nr:glycosyltransferase [Bryobacteraceae bacterium]